MLRRQGVNPNYSANFQSIFDTLNNAPTVQQRMKLSLLKFSNTELKNQTRNAPYANRWVAKSEGDKNKKLVFKKRNSPKIR
jgi:hypothetical protein